MMMSSSVLTSPSGVTDFGPENPFFVPSTLPFQAPRFDLIRDSDYQPAIEAGIAEQLGEVRAIAEDPSAPTFENTLVAMERTGALFQRVMAAFSAVAGANTNPELERVQQEEAPRLAAHFDAIYLDTQLFERVAAVYETRDMLGLGEESLRLLDVYYQRFVRAGARLNDDDKARLKQINEEESSLSNAFKSKVLAATRDGAFATADEGALAGLDAGQMGAAERAARMRGQDGWVLPLQNTTQQPYLAALRVRETRRALFQSSLMRTEQGGENDTRTTVLRLAALRAEKAKLLGFDSYAAWKLEDQMAKTPEAAVKFLDALVPAAKANVAAEAKEIQVVIDAQSSGSQEGGFTLQPWDWDFYSEQVRRAKHDLDEAEVRPYFELNSVLKNGVFYAASQLYGLRFRELMGIPVWHIDVRVYEVLEEDGSPLALFYCDNFKRDNKNGGAWMSSFVRQSKLLGTLPVIYNVANIPKPADGEAALISFSEVTTLFHEFGHALHGMFSSVEYAGLSGTSVARDFVEFPSQFNEHWATYPAIFDNYANHYETGAAMPMELAAKLKSAADFNQGYELTEVLVAAELDMEWHTLMAGAEVKSTDAFEKAALEKKGLALEYVPPRYRSSYFSHVWGGGYAAGYYAYLWAEMLNHDGYAWFEANGGLTRANGERLRAMVLSKGNVEDLATMYTAWLGREPEIAPMLKARGLLGVAG
jgi:peptidyl-dipeptidase Dcp